jgi:hypothetical protein
VESAKPTELIVKIRIPRNCVVHPSGLSKEIKGGQAGGYLVYDQKWEGSTLLDDHNIIPAIHVETMPDNESRFAIFEGHKLLAGYLGAIEKPVAGAFEPASDDKVSLPYFIGTFDFAKNFGVDDLIIGDNLKIYPKPPVKWVPFYNATERYIVYFDVFSEEEWKEREAEYTAEQERLLALERLTVDFFQPGEMQPERDHNFRGVNSTSGEAWGRKWRHATEGGSMTFEMKINSEKKNKLILTYWGGDAGNRVFDILVDGTKVGEQRLNNNVPDNFFEVEYLLEDDVFRNKDKITVMLQARPGAMAGGFFGCRTMIVEE